MRAFHDTYDPDRYAGEDDPHELAAGLIAYFVINLVLFAICMGA